MQIDLYRGEPRSIVVDYDGQDPLLVYNKSLSDITNVFMAFKQKPATDSDNMFLQKVWKTGNVETGQIVFDGSSYVFTMVINQSDYTNVLAGNYVLVLGLTVDGFSEMLEMRLSDNLIRISNDQIRA